MTSDRKLCSIVTGTWQRHDLMMEAIENVRQQTYRPLEHIIVSDGPDPELAMMLGRMESHSLRDALSQSSEDSDYDAGDLIPITYAECGRNWTTYLKNSRNAAPLIVAQLMARGEYMAWLADDERMQPDHIEALVDLMERDNTDFAYSRVDNYWVGRPDGRWVIGTDPPQCGQITNVVYRAKLLDRGLTRLGADPCPDWDQVAAWMQAGATWSYRPEVSFEHRADR